MSSGITHTRSPTVKENPPLLFFSTLNVSSGCSGLAMAFRHILHSRQISKGHDLTPVSLFFFFLNKASQFSYVGCSESS